MYRNLEAELVRKNIKRKEVANKLNVRYATLSDKLNGKWPFKLEEAVAIQQAFFPELTLDYLFKKEEEKQIN